MAYTVMETRAIYFQAISPSRLYCSVMRSITVVVLRGLIYVCELCGNSVQ